MHRMNKKSVIITFLLISIANINYALSQDDEGVCEEKKESSYEATVQKNEPYTVKTTRMSIWPPFITQVNRVAYRLVDVKQLVVKTQIIQVCCEGFEKKFDKCIPVCSGCSNGQCVGPNNCTCDPGWTGSNCTDPCSDGFYGTNCEQVCDCKDGSSCNKENGICSCPAGFYGQSCDQPCPSGLYGINCLNTCLCKNGECNKRTGECNCEKGFTGQFCDAKCPEGKYGKDCKETCHCENGAFCHHSTGCQCPVGFRGKNCSQPCSSGFYGANCKNTCQCKNADSCDPENGSCNCNPGWTGIQCETPCPDGSFGANCLEICNCSSDSECHSIKGCITRDDVLEEEMSAQDNSLLLNSSFISQRQSSPFKWASTSFSIILSLIIVLLIVFATFLLLIFLVHRPKSSIEPYPLNESKTTISSEQSAIYTIPDIKSMPGHQYDEVYSNDLAKCDKKININISTSAPPAYENPNFNNLDK